MILFVSSCFHSKTDSLPETGLIQNLLLIQAPVVNGVATGNTYYGSVTASWSAPAGESYSATLDGATVTSPLTVSTAGKKHLIVTATNNISGITATTDIQFSVVTEIILYSTSTAYTGLLGGRSGADSKCASEKATKVGSASVCTNVHALLSIASGDAIADMSSVYSVPTSIPIKSPGGTTIFSNWNALLTTAPPDTMNNILSATTYWTFAAANGALDASNNCGGANSVSGNGIVGHNAGTTDWLVYVATACSNSYELLCVCY